MKTIFYVFLWCFFILSCKDAATSTAQSAIAANLTAPPTEVKEQATLSSQQLSTNSAQDDWYWKNTIKSTAGQFEKWPHGWVEIEMRYKIKGSETTPRKLRVGHIDSLGTITLALDKPAQTQTTLDNLGNLFFSDIEDLASLQYTNGKVGYFANVVLDITKKGKVIGNLTLGNSVRTTYNLSNQSTLSMGDEGYIISFVYLDEAAQMKATEIKKNKVRRDGTNTIEAETTVVYDLDFTPGWNFVKTAVIGKYDLEHERGLNASWYKKHVHTVIPQIPEDASYFFRTPNY